MRKFIAFLLIAFIVVLAVVVANRLSVDAMAVVIGVICGVGASIPTSLLIVLVAGRRGRREEGETRGYPPVVIVNPGNPGATMPGYQRGVPYLPPVLDQGVGPRQFKVIGDEDEVTLNDLGMKGGGFS